MATILAQDTKTGKTVEVDIEDGAPLTEVQSALSEQGLRMVPSTSVKVVSEDGSPVDYPYPADMPIDAVMSDLASKGWTLADTRTGTAVPRGPSGTNPTAAYERDQINMEGVGEGFTEMIRDAGNMAVRPFMDPAEYTSRIVEQAAERKRTVDDLNRRTQALEGASSAKAYPNFARMLPRAAAEAGAEFALTRNTRSALARIGTAGAVAGGFETLDQTDRSFMESLGTGFVPGFGIGAAFSAVGETPGAAKRWLGKAMMEALEARGVYLRPDANPFHLDVPQSDLGNRPASEVAGIPLMPYEALNADGLARMTAGASRTPGGPREAFENQQAAATSAIFTDLRDRYLPNALAPNGVFDRDLGTTAVQLARDRFTALKDNMMNQVRGRFQASLRPAIVRTGTRTAQGSGIMTGGEALLPASNYLRTLRDLRRQAAETGVPEDQLSQLDKEIARIDQAGGWTLGGFQNRLMIEGQRAYGGGRTSDSFMNLSESFQPRVLYNAMMKDLDTAIAVGDEPLVQVGGAGAPPRQAYPGNPNLRTVFDEAIPAWKERPGTAPRNPMGQSDPSFDPYEDAYRAMDEAALARLRGTQDVRATATALKAARDGFAADMDVMRQVNSATVNRLLGNDAGDMTADMFRERFMGLKPDQKVETMRFLDQHIPQAANYLRGALFSSVVDEARAARLSTPGGRDTVDIGVFARTLGGLKRGEMEALLPAGMTEEGRRRVLAGMLTMETISRAPDIGMIGNQAGFIPRMRAASINLVLQNAGFVSSFLTGELAPAALERMLYTEAGIRGWMRLGQAKPGSSAFMSALASLADQAWIAERDVQEIKQRAEDHARQEQQNIQLRQQQAVPQ